ncbi:MAG: CopD family protein [Chloroflexota bacterium]|nr:CopD family protein [Chloroflexota bacterium]
MQPPQGQYAMNRLRLSLLRLALGVRRGSTALGLAIALLVMTAGPALGHALYEKSDPPSGGQLQTPGTVRVWFTEDPEPSFSEIQVLDASRKRVDLGDTTAVEGEPRALVVSVPELPDGIYTVSWRALSRIDGHVTRGVFPLVVGAADLSGAVAEAPVFVPSIGDVLARWLGYVAALGLAGGFIFQFAVVRPSLRRFADRRAVIEVADDHVARARSFGLGLTALLVVVTVAGMVFQAANAADVTFWRALGEPTARLVGTRLGLVWLARLVLALVLAGLIWQARGLVLWWGGLAASGLLSLAISANSHAAAIPSGAWLAAGLDWLHQIAAAAWAGGLASFVLLTALALRRLQVADAGRVLAALVPRFSGLAMICVAVLVLTGLFQSWLQVKVPSALATFYGGALVLKLVLVAPMVLLGAANLLVAKPRLAAALGRNRAAAGDLPGIVRRFRLAIVAEVALGIGVLLATAALTASEPARESYARQPRPVELTGAAEDANVAVRFSPGYTGLNAFDVRVTGPDGSVPADLQRVTLRFTNLDEDLGSGTVVLERRPDGSFGATVPSLSVAGTWQIEAIIRRRGREDVRAGFRVPVVGTEELAQAPSLDSVPWLTPRRVMAAGFMALGLVLAVWISRSRDVRQRERLALYAASFAVAMIGGVLYSRAAATAAPPPEARALRNPFAPDTASLARGKALYEQHCAACHGATGRGDGPLAQSLRPRPADFRVHMAAGHTDGELFAWISKGVPGTAMPAFEGLLSEEDRWHLVNYVRGFAPATE